MPVMPGTESNGTEFLSEACGRLVRGSLAGISLPDYRGDFWSWGRTGRARCGGTIHACDPFETSSRLAFLGTFVNIVHMTVVVITFANLWWRST